MRARAWSDLDEGEKTGDAPKVTLRLLRTELPRTEEEKVGYSTIRCYDLYIYS